MKAETASLRAGCFVLGAGGGKRVPGLGPFSPPAGFRIETGRARSAGFGCAFCAPAHRKPQTGKLLGPRCSNRFRERAGIDPVFPRLKIETWGTHFSCGSKQRPDTLCFPTSLTTPATKTCRWGPRRKSGDSSAALWAGTPPHEPGPVRGDPGYGGTSVRAGRSSALPFSCGWMRC